MTFAPVIEGSIPIRTPGPEFLRRFQKRVEAGLLTGKPHPRSNYAVAVVGMDRLQVRAVDGWTAINVGLNELDMQASPSGELRYRVRYWRWAKYLLGLGGTVGIGLLAVFLFIDLRAYLARHPEQTVPGLSIDQNLLLAWGMALFWGFVWPWLLIVLHKRPLRRLVERLVGEVDAGSPSVLGR
jgi:hypothetical protein